MSEPIIVALSGHKGSGKNTLASFIAKYSEDPEHFVDPEEWREACPEWFLGYGCMIAKEFAFADGIKDFCIDVLGLKPEQCYGSDEEKNTLTKYKWEDTPKRSTPPWGIGGIGDIGELMSGREVMQVFGTECVRAWFGNVWAEATIRKIRKTDCDLAIITDCRFPNEAETVLDQPRGYIVRLTRSPFAGSDSHMSEVALNHYGFDIPKCFVLDNARMTIDEQNAAAISILDTIFQQGS